MTEEAIRAQREQCADCGGALEEVYVFDSQTKSVFDKKWFERLGPTRWFRRHPQISKPGSIYTAEGTVLTFRCSRCGRIYFYGAAF